MSKFYFVFDKVAERPINHLSGLFDTDAEAVRSILIPLSQQYPLKDCELRCVDEDINELPLSVVSWEAYKMPESKADAFAPLGSEAVKVISEYENKNRDIINKDNTDPVSKE